MSSPQQPTVSLSQFTMLSSSPLKPSTFYFNEQDTAAAAAASQSEFRPQALSFSAADDDEFSHTQPIDDESDQFETPADQQQNQQQEATPFLQYPPSIAQSNSIDFDMAQLQQQFHQQQFHQHQQMLQQHHHQQQQHHVPQQAVFQHVSAQLNLYPPMEFMPAHSGRAAGIKESFSTNTLASHDSVPLLAMSSSISDNSIASPMSLQTQTPRRTATSRRTSTLTTTPSQPHQFQTPSQNTSFTSPITLKTAATPSSSSVQKSRSRHRRSRSRLSLDASGAASIVTVNPTRSPATTTTGTNPFYTPSTSFLSPHSQQTNAHFDSPQATPLATPSGMKRFHSFNSISPNMLMNAGAAYSQHENHELRANSSIYTAAADLTVKLASKYIDQPDRQQNIFNEPLVHRSQSQPQRPTLSLSASQPNFLSESFNSDMSSSRGMDHIPEQGGSSNSTTAGPSPSNTPVKTVTVSGALSKSHSSINLAAIIAPPEIQHYDILEPRKQKISKTKSMTAIMQTNEELIKMGKQPKKVHVCPLCNAAFQRPEHVKRHMRSHSSEKPFACEEPDCGKRFNRPDNLKAHLRKIHKKTDV